MESTGNMKYIGTYNVVKLFRKSNRRQILERSLSRSEAKQIVSSFPDSNTSIVFFEKQFLARKYFK